MIIIFIFSIFSFKTDFSNGDTGFHLEFESEGCSAYLTKPSGTFQTPNYPNPYPHNTQCIWKIEVPYGNLIEVTIHDFDFEAMPSCAEDGLIVCFFLEIYFFFVFHFISDFIKIIYFISQK